MVIVAILLATAPAAFAVPSRTFQSSFGSFSAQSPQALTVDQSNGDVYAIDLAANKVLRFTAAGAPHDFTAGANKNTNSLTGFSFQNAAQVAVDNSGGPADGDVYVTETAKKVVKVFSSAGALLATLTGAGTPAGSFSSPCGVAVDQASGRVYIGDSSNRIWRYTPVSAVPSEANYSGGVATSASFSPCALAADSGNVYAADSLAEGPARKFDAADFATGSPPSPGSTQIDPVATALAVDPSNGAVYVDEGSEVSAFDASGAPLYGFGSSAQFGFTSAGVAVTGANGNAYVADRHAGGNQIDVFSPAASLAPTALTKPAGAVHHTSGLLQGRLLPGSDIGGAVDPIVDCHFEWGTDTSYTGGAVPCAEGNSFSAPTSVTATLGFLTPAVTYHFRLVVATATSGPVAGADQSFTPSVFPVVHNEVANFGPDGTPGSIFTAQTVVPSTRFGYMTFLQSSRRLFVLDSLNDEPGKGIYGFDVSAPPSYSPLPDFSPHPITLEAGNEPSIATDNTALASAGNIYYHGGDSNSGDEHLIYGYDSAGAPLGGNFPIDPATNPGGADGAPAFTYDIAVDGSGNLWVAYQGSFQNPSPHLLKYNSAGVFQGSLDVLSQVGDKGVGIIEFDSQNNLYVSTYIGGSGEGEGVWKYTASSGYTVATKVFDRSVNAIAVDPVDHHVFVLPRQPLFDEASGKVVTGVVELDESGNRISIFGDGIGSGELYDMVVDETNHHVYISDRKSGKIYAFGAGITQELATVTGQAPSGVTGNTATLHALVDPEGHFVEDCRFEYGTSTKYGQSAPCAQAPGSGSGDVAVSADVSLAAGTTYHFRIVATNANGFSRGPDQTLTTLGPRLSNTAVSQITASDATLSAQVNPVGKPTTYHFEYGSEGPCDSNPCIGKPAPDASAGAANAPSAVARAIAGLEPATTYHFRIVATNADATSFGPDGTFTTYPSTPAFGPCSNDAFRAGRLSGRLPDCRAFEQASPTDKNGADVNGDTDRVQASTSGDAVTFFVVGGMAGGVGAQEFPSFVARRSASGWLTEGLLPPASAGTRASLKGWTPDLEMSFAAASPADLSKTTFLARDADGSLSSIAETPKSGYTLVGASEDGSKVFFEFDGGQLVPEAAAGKDNLYVWDRGSGEISLAGVLPDSACGSPPCVPTGGSFGGPYDWSPRAGNVAYDEGGASARYYAQAVNVVSHSGNRAYFTAGGTGQVYLRKDAASAGASTAAVSASQRATPDPNGPQPAIFREATPDGSTAFFTSCEKLTDDSTAVSTGEFGCTKKQQGSDLYAYDAASGQLTDLTVDANPTDPQGADVKGVIGSSADGSYVYFAANGDLDGGGPATGGDCPPHPNTQTGECSIYLAHAGEITFVARVAGIDRAGDNWKASPGQNTGFWERKARVASDGKTLIFLSAAQLTALDTAGNDQIYRYRAPEQELVCVSCSPSGHANGGADLQTVRPPGPLTPANTGTVLTRNLSADGNRVFFDSSDKLVAADTNGRMDVYEWEAEGTGSCEAPGGCVYLISLGTGPNPSRFADASASGDEVFFFTRDRLVPQDQDDLQDVYVARVGGGLALQNAVAPPPCSGEACRGAFSPVPAPQGSASSSFSGPGNPPVKRPPSKCKGKRQGRKCIQKKPHQKKPHRRARNDRGGRR